MRFAVLLPFALALGAAPVLAAPASAADVAPAPQSGWQRPSPEQMEARRAAMQAERSTNIALLLGLRADQKPALDGYLAAAHRRGMHDHGMNDGVDRFRRAPGEAPMAHDDSTLAALDRQSKRIDEHDADAKQRIEATRHFYASLTPEQQKRFDAMTQLMHGRWQRDGMDGHHDHH